MIKPRMDAELPASCQTTDLVLRSDPADPRKPTSGPLVWDVGYRQLILSQAPAQLDIAVNGVKVNTIARWDYSKVWLTNWWSPTSAPPGWRAPKPGESVTITVTPTRATDGWLTIFGATDGEDMTVARDFCSS